VTKYEPIYFVKNYLQISKTIFRVQNALTFSPDTEDYVQRSSIVRAISSCPK